MSWSHGSHEGAERPVLNGNRISYAPQEPFVFDGTLRENVIHFADWDEAKYHRILTACALERDLAEMELGDATLLGSRGYQLSGGQRARVALARTLYLDADVYVADMTLSALDAAVARQVFDATFSNNGLLGSRTRVLVSHSSVVCDCADHLVRIQSTGEVDVVAVQESPSNLVVEDDRLWSESDSADLRKRFSSHDGASTSTKAVADEVEHLDGVWRTTAWYTCFSGTVIPVIVAILVLVSQIAVLSLGELQYYRCSLFFFRQKGFIPVHF